MRGTGRVKKYLDYIFELMSGQGSRMKFAKYCEILFKPRLMFLFRFSEILIQQMVSVDEFVFPCKTNKNSELHIFLFNCYLAAPRPTLSHS